MRYFYCCTLKELGLPSRSSNLECSWNVKCSKSCRASRARGTSSRILGVFKPWMWTRHEKVRYSRYWHLNTFLGPMVTSFFFLSIEKLNGLLFSTDLFSIEVFCLWIPSRLLPCALSCHGLATHPSVQSLPEKDYRTDGRTCRGIEPRPSIVRVSRTRRRRFSYLGLPRSPSHFLR